MYVDRAVVRYVRQLAEASRELQHVKMGLSARGCLALVRVAKTWAAADGRTTVVPADITTLAAPVLCHRLLLDPQAQFSGVSVDDVIERLLGLRRAPDLPRLTVDRPWLSRRARGCLAGSRVVTVHRPRRAPARGGRRCAGSLVWPTSSSCASSR